MGTARLKASMLTTVDMITALEIHIPSMRSLHHQVSPLTIRLSEWDTQLMSDFDSLLRGNRKDTRLAIDEALRKYTYSTIRFIPIDQIEFDSKEIDLHLCLMIVKHYAKMNDLAASVLASYSMPYQVLTQKLTREGKFAFESDEIHLHYGSFNKAKIRFNTELESVQEKLNRLVDYAPFLSEVVAGIIELGMRANDILQTVQKLNGVHHKGLDLVREKVF